MPEGGPTNTSFGQTSLSSTHPSESVRTHPAGRIHFVGSSAVPYRCPWQVQEVGRRTCDDIEMSHGLGGCFLGGGVEPHKYNEYLMSCFPFAASVGPNVGPFAMDLHRRCC